MMVRIGAVLDYLTAEIIEVSGYSASSTISSWDILAAIKTDEVYLFFIIQRKYIIN